MSEYEKIIDQYLKRKGIVMAKLLNSGGLFSSPTYDTRTAGSLQELYRLNREGFKIYDTDVGVWLFNAMLQYEPNKKKSSKQ